MTATFTRTDITIRPEQVSDYHDIAELNAITFTYSFGMTEVPLISVLRNRRSFDPELSLVAEHEGRIVGHVLFTPQPMYMSGAEVRAVILAPVAVHPEYQCQGIGSILIEEGHKRADSLGFDLSLLVGHPNYYPRFGYQPNTWGSAEVIFSLNDIPASTRSISERRVQSSDVQKLLSMWEKWFGHSSLTLKPGSSITDWISCGKGVHTSAILIDDTLSGYMRYEKNNPNRILSILADDAEALLQICSYHNTKLNPAETDVLSLPLPADSQPLQSISIPYRTEVSTGPHCMLKMLNTENQRIIRYCNEVNSKTIQPGLVIWPVEFE